MPYHDRAKARLEHEVTILRREVARMRSKQILRRRARLDQDALKARLEQEVNMLRHELIAVRGAHEAHIRQCGGEEERSRIGQQLIKLDKHVVKQDRYIAFLEEQINVTRTKYRQRMDDVKQSTRLVEMELKKVRNEMRTIVEHAGKAEELQKRVGLLTAKLERRNSIIARYDTRHEELMGLVASYQTQEKQEETSPSAALRSTGGGGRAFHLKGSADLVTGDQVTSVLNEKVEPLIFNCLSTALRKRLDARATR